MLWNWLTQILRAKTFGRSRAGSVGSKRRLPPLELEVLEARVLLVVGGVSVAPGGPFDGVVKIADANFSGSGSLLYDNNHILTAAHVLAANVNQQVTFNLVRQNDPGVGMGVVLPVNITLNVPANGGTNQFQTIDPTYNAATNTDDLAILTLPDQTPAAGQAAGRLVAPYYGPNSGYQISNTYLLPSGGPNDPPPTVTFVGYGVTGTGLTGETNDEVQQITLTNPTPTTMFTLTFNGKTTAALPESATPQKVASALGSLLTILSLPSLAIPNPPLNIAVYKPDANTPIWDVRFINALGSQALATPVTINLLLFGTVTAGAAAAGAPATQVLTGLLYGGGHGIAGKTSGQNQFDQEDPNRPNVLLADFDSGFAANSSFGSLGVPGEALIGFGDSGGPALIQDNGLWKIAAVASNVSTSRPPTTATDYVTLDNLFGNPIAFPDSSFGDIAGETDVYPYKDNFIRPMIPTSANYTGGSYDLVLDMNYQVLGRDQVNDNITITASRVGDNLQLYVYDQNSPSYTGVYYSAPAANITSLTIRTANNATGTANNDTIVLDGNLGLGGPPSYPQGATTGPVTIYEGSGNDDVIIGDGQNTSLDDLTGPVTVYGGHGNDGLYIDDSAAAAGHTYTVTSSSIRRMDKPTITYYDQNTVGLFTSQFNDVVNVQSTDVDATTDIHTNGGNDTVNVGSTNDSSGSLDGLRGQLILIGGGGEDNLYFYDQGTNPGQPLAGHTYTITSSTVTRDTGPAITYSGMETLYLMAGNYGNTINIQSTAVGTDTNVYAGDDDNTINVMATAYGTDTTIYTGNGDATTVNVGNTNDPLGSSLDDIQGALIVNGGAGAAALHIDDTGSTPVNTPTYTVTNSSVTRDDDFALSYTALDSLFLATGAGPNNVNILSTSAVTRIYSPSGEDTITVASGPPLPNRIDGILGVLTIAAEDDPTSNDLLIVDDSGNTGPFLYHVAKAFISRDGGPMINTINIKQRKLKMAAGGSVTQVLSNLSGTALTVDGGAGANTFAIGNDANRLDDVQGIVQLNGASSADTVQFNDQGYGGGESYLLVGKILDVGRLADFNVFLDGISHVALNTGSGDDAIILDNPDPELQLALDGGAGSDEVIVAAGVVIGPHLVNIEAVNITGGELDLAGQTLDLPDGLRVESAGVLSGPGAIIGDVTNAGEVVAQDGALFVDGDYTQIYDGLTNVADYSALAVSGVVDEQGGAVNLFGGSLTAADGVNVGANAVLAGDGTINGNVVNAGEVDVGEESSLAVVGNYTQTAGGLTSLLMSRLSVTGFLDEQGGNVNLLGGSLEADNGYTIESSAALSGFGNVTADVVNAGAVTTKSAGGPSQLTISAGSSGSSANVLGTFTQTINGVLNLRILGAGINDSLNAVGAHPLSETVTETLNGTVNVLNPNNYSPVVGDTFALLDGVSLGQFAT
ncbi:MAG TPA: hypothetical protein DDY78_19170, partial [Planctomycetales bacterium]|nr:hypothetical protein [Planctomycetales bacterium]